MHLTALWRGQKGDQRWHRADGGIVESTQEGARADGAMPRSGQSKRLEVETGRRRWRPVTRSQNLDGV
ncbi:uncharacterized protein P884DRAFT_260511 [Thermothelomyces heterothallicus CBS 202.75]|uniref:uncharacterized protein n=1 Tax=Thermothelomyces heterothallicus CBS 202.75 TaxID=1149848 RepID=UPI003743B7E3